MCFALQGPAVHPVWLPYMKRAATTAPMPQQKTKYKDMTQAEGHDSDPPRDRALTMLSLIQALAYLEYCIMLRWSKRGGKDERA